MKKLLVLVCAIAIVMASAVTAFAATSPSAEPLFKINFSTYASGNSKPSTNYVVEGDTIKFTASASNYTFKGWDITGTYEIVSGSPTSTVLVIRPKSDITVVETFKEVGPTSSSATGSTSSDAPKTGDAFGIFAAIIALVSAGAFVAVKKSSKAF